MEKHLSGEVLHIELANQVSFLNRPVIERALREAVLRETQPDGRVRYWVFIPELGKYLRVVTLEDGETVHNAFPDRDFKL